MRKVLCLCSTIPRLRTTTRVVLVAHWRELKTTTNSGRLGTLALPNSEIWVRGERGVAFGSQYLLPKDRKPLLLYPSEGAPVLTSDWLEQNPGPFTLIVPDGTWGQAGKVARREPMLASVPQVKVLGTPSNYRLRRAPRPEALSTLEAMAIALGVIESQEVQTALELLLERMVERTLWTRGMLKAEDCLSGIPKEAFV